jgi:glycosyltransferase involved in cell wall biosynthesis
LAIAARHSTQFLGKLRKLVVQTHPDVVIFDHTAMFQYATDLPWPAVTVGNAHDVYTQAWNRKAMRARNPLAHLLLGTESRRMANWEKRICAELDLVLTLNEKDKRLLEELQSAAQVIVVNPRISIPNCDPASVREPGSMLFCGAMDRPENADGVRWAVRSILPAIRLAVPNAKLYVAGSDGERLAHEFAGQEGVTITGFVPDLGRLMSRMEIALLPLRLGAGIKFKTLECMAAGLPTITTSIGAEGIAGSHGIHYLVAESEEEIASHAIELLKNSEARREMGAQAKTFITTTCDFSETMKLVEEALIDAVAKRKTVQNRDPALHSA